MAVDERRRSELYERMAATIGPEATATMFDMLPPAGDRGATASDIDGVSHRVDGLSNRMDGLSNRMDGLSDRVDHRFDEFEEKLDLRFDGLRNELLAAFRGELVTAVSGQTRALIVAAGFAVFGIGGLALTLAQLL